MKEHPGPAGDASIAGDTARERIMGAVLQLVGERGAQGVTVREIAARAGVNVGAVNYYFTSKDQLVAEALQRFVRRQLDLLALLEDVHRPPRERLVSFVDAYAAGLLEHPGIVRGLVHMFQAEGPLPAPLSDAFERGTASLRRVLEEIAPAAEDLDARVLTLFSSIQYPVLLSGRLRQVFGLDLRDPAQRERYVRALVQEVAGA